MSLYTEAQSAPAWLVGAVVWRCVGCPRVLGFVAPGVLYVKHARRVIEVKGEVQIRQVCDDCGATNDWPHAPRTEGTGIA